MNIVYSDERLPEALVLEKMQEAGKICLEMENVPEDRTEVSLSFVSGDEIRVLNRDFRDVDRVTDVLSFPQFDDLNDIPEEGSIILGDVVICTEQALSQAEEYGHAAERELVYLFVHSMFHLLGYDHMEEDEKAEMRAAEEKVMSAIGLER